MTNAATTDCCARSLALLDVLGDRWTLLILRDLHAGPARFQELHEGLGIATNLLSTRLAELTESGMIERSNEAGYQLTDAGRGTDRVLWELTRFGAGLGRDAHPREPGNLRTIALPLRILLESVATDRTSEHGSSSTTPSSPSSPPPRLSTSSGDQPSNPSTSSPGPTTTHSSTSPKAS